MLLHKQIKGSGDFLPLILKIKWKQMEFSMKLLLNTLAFGSCERSISGSCPCGLVQGRVQKPAREASAWTVTPGKSRKHLGFKLLCLQLEL